MVLQVIEGLNGSIWQNCVLHFQSARAGCPTELGALPHLSSTGCIGRMLLVRSGIVEEKQDSLESVSLLLKYVHTEFHLLNEIVIVKVAITVFHGFKHNL